MPRLDPEYSEPQYGWLECMMLEATDPDIRNCECHYAAPYGFVVMADCPRHD